MNKKSLPSPFEEALRDLLSCLKESQAKGLIIGGIAASLIGRPRVTHDIDLLVLMEESKWSDFFVITSRFGFVPRLKDALSFARKNRVLLLRHSASGIDIDVSFGALPFEEESIKRVVTLKIGTLSLPLPTAEDLIIMKAVAHRPKDMMDIEAVAETNPRLDRRRIFKWVREFSKVLEKPEIYGDLKKILKS